MKSGLTLLASIGSTSPFVGLFGTVLGIMHAMHEITASGSTSLHLYADQDVVYSKVAEVMTTVQHAGIAKIAFVTVEQ